MKEKNEAKQEPKEAQSVQALSDEQLDTVAGGVKPSDGHFHFGPLEDTGDYL